MIKRHRSEILGLLESEVSLKISYHEKQRKKQKEKRTLTGTGLQGRGGYYRL
jgi:hypothetical protein